MNTPEEEITDLKVDFAIVVTEVALYIAVLIGLASVPLAAFKYLMGG